MKRTTIIFPLLALLCATSLSGILDPAVSAREAINQTAGTKAYRCIPCGCRMDEKVFEQPGSCPACQMALVDDEVDSIFKFLRLSDQYCTGGQPTMEQLVKLKAEKIKAIINLRHTDEPAVADERIKAEALGLRYFHIPVRFREPRDEQMDEFLRITDDPANRPAFIHCAAAVRVGAFWMIRRVLRDGWTIEKAEAEAKKIGLHERAAHLQEFARSYIERHQQTPAISLPSPQNEVFQQDLAWSPDGRWVAFSEYAGGKEYKPDRWAIHIIGADGSGRRLLSENAMYVSWAPDGKTLVFGSPRDGNAEIYVIDADGSNLRRLTDNPAKDHQPAWSSKGDKIAFSSNRDGNEEIYVMAADGSQVTRLTNHPAKDFNPAWSPDASRLVFYREKGDGMDQIYVVAADGSKEWAITQDDANNVFPSFLPDGRIAFTSGKKGGTETLVTVAADGTGRRQVGTVEAFFARWSPDGTQVAFIAGTGWPRSAIYLMRPDGTAIRKIVN